MLIIEEPKEQVIELALLHNPTPKGIHWKHFDIIPSRLPPTYLCYMTEVTPGLFSIRARRDGEKLAQLLHYINEKQATQRNQGT